MTVNISKPALNLREELAALRNQGGAYEESKFYLDGLLDNPSFNVDFVGWGVVNGAAAVVSGKARLTSTSTSWPSLTQTLVLEVGKTYTLNTNSTSGTMPARIQAGTPSSGTEYAYQNLTDGNNTFTFTATSVTLYLKLQGYPTASGQTCDFDHASVYETDGTNAIHSTPHGYSIKDVYIDGELAREGSAYDYTVHDGYIKPTIAPTATTETCLIGVRT